jgi:plastocyanin
MCTASAALLLAAGCGGSSSSSGSGPSPAPPQQTGPGFFITISGMAFSPLNLHVPPGGMVTVQNLDGMPHSVTSEASTNAFVPGSVSGISFNTGPFTGTMSFTVPSNAASGTVIPFFCTVHTSTMATPNGSITIDPSAAATSAPPGSGTPTTGGGGY